MTFVITSPCIGEKAADCVTVCPVDCIVEAEEQYFIDPSICIECGACETACPVEAIFHVDELSDEDQIYLDKAKEFFA